MKFKFANWEEAAAALVEGDVDASNVADNESARHLWVAMKDALNALPESPNLDQLEYGQWLHGEMTAIDCELS